MATLVATAMIFSPSSSTLSPSRRTIRAAVDPDPGRRSSRSRTRAAAARAARSLGDSAVVVTAIVPYPEMALNPEMRGESR